MPRRAWRRRNRPARLRPRCDRGIALTAHEKRGYAAPGRAHGEAAAGGEIISAIVIGKDSCNDRQRRILKAFLQRPEDAPALRRDHLDQPIRIATESREADRIKRALPTHVIAGKRQQREAGAYTKHLRKDAHAEPGERGEIAWRSGKKLMERAGRKPSAGQRFVKRCRSQGN